MRLDPKSASIILVVLIAIPVAVFVLAYSLTRVGQSHTDRAWGPTQNITILSVGKLHNDALAGPQRLDLVKLTSPTGQIKVRRLLVLADYKAGDQDKVRINRKSGEIAFADTVGFLPPYAMGLIFGFIAFAIVILPIVVVADDLIKAVKDRMRNCGLKAATC